MEVQCQCAYCGRSGKMTREHLIPHCLLKRTSTYTFKFLERAQSVIKGEQTVRDVCEDCNSGILSKLDTYACQLHDEFFSTIVREKSQVSFQYDYHRLTRWLLKVSYNSARVNNEGDADLLSQARGYVLTGVDAPTHLKVFLQLVIPYTLGPAVRQSIPPSDIAQLPRNADGLPEIPPAYIRISSGKANDGSLETVICRMIALNSYYFYLLLARESGLPLETWDAATVRIQNQLDGVHVLDSQSNEMQVRASKIHIVASCAPTVLGNRAVFQNWLKKRDGGL